MAGDGLGQLHEVFVETLIEVRRVPPIARDECDAGARRDEGDEPSLAASGASRALEAHDEGTPRVELRIRERRDVEVEALLEGVRDRVPEAGERVRDLGDRGREMHEAEGRLARHLRRAEDVGVVRLGFGSAEKPLPTTSSAHEPMTMSGARATRMRG